MDRMVTFGTRAPTEELEITAYASFAILALFLWDWILCIPREVDVVHRTRLNVPIVAYYLSRLCSLGYCICVVFNSLSVFPPRTQVEVNMHVEVSKMALWWATVSTTSLLFFFRIRAVYHNSKAVQVMFSALWLLVITTPVITFVSSHLICNPTSSGQKSCKTRIPLSLPSNAIAIVNDTFVFLGVSRQIYRNAVIGEPVTRTKRFKLLVLGEGLYKVSKSLLQGGQMYYGMTIGFQIASAMAAFFSLPYQESIGMSYIALSTAMACKVFRMVLLCDTSMDPLSTREIQSRLRAVSADSRIP